MVCTMALTPMLHELSFRLQRAAANYRKVGEYLVLRMISESTKPETATMMAAFDICKNGTSIED